MRLYRIGECRRWRFWLLLPRQKELALARKLLLLAPAFAITVALAVAVAFAPSKNFLPNVSTVGGMAMMGVAALDPSYETVAHALHRLKAGRCRRAQGKSTLAVLIPVAKTKRTRTRTKTVAICNDYHCCPCNCSRTSNSRRQHWQSLGLQ